MKAKALAQDLLRMVEQHGEGCEVVFQDSMPGEHPDGCKHEHFFVVEEPKDGSTDTGIEVVLRTWPY